MNGKKNETGPRQRGKEMKIYQNKTGAYTLPRSVYYRMIYFIKDYPRLIDAADALLEATPTPTETPEIQRQRNLQATETANIKYAEFMKDIREIESALKKSVPADAQAAILRAVIYDAPYPIDKDKRTYSRYKQRFIYTLAKERNLI